MKYKTDDLESLVEKAKQLGAVRVGLEVVTPDRPGHGVKVDANAPLTVAQAAERFNLGKRTIYRLVETGEIDAVRVGRAIRIRPAALETYLARQGPRAGLYG